MDKLWLFIYIPIEIVVANQNHTVFKSSKSEELFSKHIGLNERLKNPLFAHLKWICSLILSRYITYIIHTHGLIEF